MGTNQFISTRVNGYHLLIILGLILASCSGNKTETDLCKYVNPFIGTGGHGHTFPGACLPFGMVQLSPDNEKQGWDWCSGYHQSDSIIVGFSHTHLSGTGCGDFLDVVVNPYIGEIIEDTTKKGKNFIYRYKSTFSHQNETASPGYYSVLLDRGNIKAELTATQRAGFHRYTFPESTLSKIIFDMDSKGGWDTMLVSNIQIEGNNAISGYTFTSGWAANQKVYFYARLSKPFNKFYTSETGELVENRQQVTGKSCKAVLCFQTISNEEITVKVGLSSSGIENAKENLEKEIGGKNFDQIRQQSKEKWNNSLSRYTIKSDDESKKRIFYTAVYHSLIAPNLYSDVNGSYTGFDGKVKQSTGSEVYSTFSLWDTFRGLHPLLTIFEPTMVSKFIQSMLVHYREFGILPVWSLWGNETYCMIGYHSIPVILDAYRKGISGFDPNEAFQAMKASSMGKIEGRFFNGLDMYMEHGYVPYDIETKRSGCDVGTVSRTLEWAYDDWCIAEMAKELKLDSEYEYYSKRAKAYEYVADNETGFMRSKDSKGNWKENFNPEAVDGCNGFTEGNSWQYSWFVPHNIEFLVSMMGGKEKFAQKLDLLFEKKGDSPIEIWDVTGLIGQYAHGNEPSHHVAYLFNYAGQPWRTQEVVSLIRDSLYTDRPDGICGNDDCGQISAWYIFSAMGFYPVNPANGLYLIGTPTFEELSLNLENGKHFTVSAKNFNKKNIYIQSATLNGKPLNRFYITHSEIMQGGKLVFVMGDKPNKQLWN